MYSLPFHLFNHVEWPMRTKSNQKWLSSKVFDTANSKENESIFYFDHDTLVHFALQSDSYTSSYYYLSSRCFFLGLTNKKISNIFLFWMTAFDSPWDTERIKFRKVWLLRVKFTKGKYGLWKIESRHADVHCVVRFLALNLNGYHKIIR